MEGVCVRMKGLEPPRLSALDPKSNAATNYATSASERHLGVAKVILFFQFKHKKSLRPFFNTEKTNRNS